MRSLAIEDVVDYVEKNIGVFHRSRLDSLERLRLDDILHRKNPYLFKAKNILTAQDLVKTLLDAHLSSQEETIFGDFLEGLARFVCEKAFGGKKSVAEGIDLEFDRDGIRYIVSVKSGPNWGNSSQVARMKDNFQRAKKILRTGGFRQQITAVNGCCYGRDNRPDKGEYMKFCGQAFWEFISGNPSLYLEIIEPLGHKAKYRNEEFLEAYSQIINRFTLQFSQQFCSDGKILWDSIVKLNSSITNRSHFLILNLLIQVELRSSFFCGRLPLETTRTTATSFL